MAQRYYINNRVTTVNVQFCCDLMLRLYMNDIVYVCVELYHQGRGTTAQLQQRGVFCGHRRYCEVLL